MKEKKGYAGEKGTGDEGLEEKMRERKMRRIIY